MFKKALLIVLLLSLPCFGEEVTYHYERTIAAADTVAAVHTWDTMFTRVIPIGNYKDLWFQLIYDGWDSDTDTDWVDDTVRFDFQTSIDQVNWTTYGTTIGTVSMKSADLDTIINAALKINRDSVWTGVYGRARIIYHDSLEADSPDLLGNTYGKKFQVNISTVK